MTVRDTKEYKEMSASRMMLLTYTEADSEEEQLAFWQMLVDTGLAWQLEGWYGRCAMSMIEDEVIEPPTGG